MPNRQTNFVYLLWWRVFRQITQLIVNRFSRDLTARSFVPLPSRPTLQISQNYTRSNQKIFFYLKKRASNLSRHNYCI